MISLKYLKHFILLLFTVFCLNLAAPQISYAEDGKKVEDSKKAEDNKKAEGGEQTEDVKEHTCSEAFIKSMYYGEDYETSKSKCWYCRVVIVMTNAYLQAAESSIPTTVELGHLILKLGFVIWLAIFLLKQLSSMSQITPGKMLQEILIMAFKCAFSYYALDMGTDFITNYILNPIMITGTDIGSALLDGLMAKGGNA